MPPFGFYHPSTTLRDPSKVFTVGSTIRVRLSEIRVRFLPLDLPSELRLSMFLPLYLPSELWLSMVLPLDLPFELQLSRFLPLVCRPSAFTVVSTIWVTALGVFTVVYIYHLSYGSRGFYRCIYHLSYGSRGFYRCIHHLSYGSRGFYRWIYHLSYSSRGFYRGRPIYHPSAHTLCVCGYIRHHYKQFSIITHLALAYVPILSHHHRPILSCLRIP